MKLPAYGDSPKVLASLSGMDLREVMYYLYLPVRMQWSSVRLPPNLECCRPIVEIALSYANTNANHDYEYVYLSARKGWATLDNPLNRPGWHADGFGTDDLNFVWWKGPGTRFAIQPFNGISSNHVTSLAQFEAQIKDERIETYREGVVLVLTPHVVHSTPIIHTPCWRQYVKVSLSDHRYNLENNSHNYLFDYQWPLHSREEVRNDPHKAQRDYA